MTKLFMGWKSGVGGVVKVMKNNADDALTTPNTSWGKYLFNSETQDIGYLADAFRNLRDPTNFPSAFYPYYRPGGTGPTTFEYAVLWRSSLQEWLFALSRFYGLGITPICEARPYTALGVTRAGPNTHWVQTGSYNQGTRYVGHINGYTGYGTKLVTSVTYGTPEGLITLSGSPGYLLSLYPDATGYIVSTWDLPANSAALPSPSGTPTTGQKTVQINPSIVKVARPGFDVGSASGRQLILDSTRIPAKIVAAGEVTIAAGSSATIPVKFPLTALAYMDYHVRRSTDSLTHPAFIGSGWTDDQHIGLNYRVNANSVVLFNVGTATLVVRYMICVDDASANTSGGRKVMFRGNDGSQDFIQIKRPGSSDSAPNMSEIMLDTRLAYIPILTEGYLSAAQFTESPTSAAYGNKAKTISFTNDGDFMPFVKYSVIFADGTIRTPITKLLKSFLVSSTWNNQQGSDGTVALITNTSVKFHLANGNPTELRLDSNGQVVAVSDPDDQPVGIRYYIFGIPTSL